MIPASACWSTTPGLRLDGLLANADLDNLERLIQLNVTTVTRLASAAARVLPRLVAARSSTLPRLWPVSRAFQRHLQRQQSLCAEPDSTLNAELDGTGVKVQAVLPGVTRTEIWERSGIDASGIPAEMVMDAGEMVDAALAGLDQGELITIPSLPDAGEWQAFVAARMVMAPNLSRSSAASRYK